MFWRFGGYANTSAIDTLLDKPECTLEELLDESDLIQELKQNNAKLVEYLRDDLVLEKLLAYVVAPKPEEPKVPPVENEESQEADAEDTECKGKEKQSEDPQKCTEEDDDEKEKKRNKYAYVSAEVLSSDTWSISEALMEKEDLLRKFWGFLKGPVPLNPLQASYFTKVNESLLDKKTDEMLKLFKSIDDVVPNMLQHVDSPMVMDLLLKIISLEKTLGGEGIVDWLHSQNTMPILLGFLSSEHSWATQTSAGDFLKAIITISANASQNEQSCIGPNQLTRQLVSQPCIEKLIQDMLKGGNPLTVGVGIVIEVIRKNNSDYDPELGEPNTIPSSRDPIYLGTLLRMFAKHVPDFMALILSPNHTIGGGSGPMTIKRKELDAAFNTKIEPLGFDRFKTCELMAELLHCSNMGLLNEPGSEEFVEARNLERERLRLEGKLSGNRKQEPESINEGESPEVPSYRVMTAEEVEALAHSFNPSFKPLKSISDDDGFEEVSHDLGDETKDDFDEIMATSTKADLSISFPEQDDEEFVDEPLSSPRLQQAEIAQPETMIHAEDIPAPLSPNKTSHSEASEKEAEVLEEVEEEAKTEEGGAAADEETASPTIPESDAPESRTEDAASLETREDTTPEMSTLVLLPSVTEPPENTDFGNFSPHPEDQPAPLFSKKTESSSIAISEPPAPDSVESSEPNGSREDADTTMAEASGSHSSEDADEASKPVADEPICVVGDYLKMQFVEHKVVPTILDFFFRFPWNNFLHNVVYDVVQQVFNGPMDRGFNRTLAIDLFDTGDITARIVAGQERSDKAQAATRMRLGYMGHLTLISEEVVKFTERHPPELLSESILEKATNNEWVTYVETTLTETRERDNAILGGVRPDLHNNPRQAVMSALNAASLANIGSPFNASSSVLADAGLNGSASLDSIDLGNGNSGSNGGSFTLTGGGSALSGFGSSSDEEEDEMDDDLEEESDKLSSGGGVAGGSGGAIVGAGPAVEFSRYITTPSTTTATTSPDLLTHTPDLSPPSGPPPSPPPAPLSIPPSRARRQLAARLALHKLNEKTDGGADGNDRDGSSGAGENEGDGDGEGELELDRFERSERRVNLNPFATDEDDDEEEDGEEGERWICDGGELGGPVSSSGLGVGQGEKFTIGDLEVEEEGMGHLPPGTGLVGSGDVLAEGGGDKQSSSDSSTSDEEDSFHSSLSGNNKNLINQNGSGSGEGGSPRKEKERRPSTTEALRRTSLEDDDEDVGGGLLCGEPMSVLGEGEEGQDQGVGGEKVDKEEDEKPEHEAKSG